MEAAEPTRPTSETRTLLVTDVVDSTRLAESLGDLAMAELGARHDRIARDLLALHGGREIDKTDGFLLLFDDPRAGVAYAGDYHRAIGLLEPPLRARAGLHVARVVIRANPAHDVARGAKPLEVEGVAKAVAARIMALAMPRQTLATPEAVEALGELPTGLELVSHGHWRLKGVLEPVALSEVGAPGEAPFVPPSDAAKAWRVHRVDDQWVPVRDVRRHLPAERDRFVGRERDLHELADTFDEGARLVSVLGVGGTGKTRLALRYGWTWLGEYEGGVWFCDCSEARSVDGIVAAVATALDVPLAAGDPVAQLGHAIAARGRCLVVLDNFEQVARHASETVGRWLDRAERAAFVVTTREILGLRGETALALAPLPPDDAVELFVTRAVQAKRDFVATGDDARALPGLVRLLDGLPLAIELAAARVRLMSPRVLVARMGERFSLLAAPGGRRDRQATLRATLDWSWELLSPAEQAALAQISVFEGGFSLSAAEAVLVLDDAWPTDALQALVDKSLLRVVGDDRFDVLVSVQEYAAERLSASGARERVERRHYECFAAAWAADDADTSPQARVQRFLGLAREIGNLVAAVRRAVAHGAVGAAVGLIGPVVDVLTARGPLSLAHALAADVAALPGLDGVAKVHAVCRLAKVLRWIGRGGETHAPLVAALEAARQAGDRRLEAQVRVELSMVLREAGRPSDARVQVESALAIAPDARAEAHALGELGILDAQVGALDTARVHLEAALARDGHTSLLGNLGRVLAELGRLDEALVRLEQALDVDRLTGDRTGEAVDRANVGSVYVALGRVPEGRAHYEAALALSRELGIRAKEGMLLANLANLANREGRHDEARAGFEAALEVYREVGNRRMTGNALANLGLVALRQGRLDEAAVQLDAAEPVLRETGDRPGLVRLWCGRVSILASAGRSASARAALAEAERLAGELPPGLLDAEVARARREVPPDRP